MKISKKQKDRVGLRYKYLTVKRFLYSIRLYNKNCAIWECECVCGKLLEVKAFELSNRTSCGCMYGGKPKLTLLYGGATFYEIWHGMKIRCDNPKNKAWKYYGGKGIKVCDEWLSFENFAKDMYPSYRKGLTLDRIDSNGNYYKQNCRWATIKEQILNKSTTRIIEYNGEIKCLADWARYFKICRKLLSKRLNKNLSLEEAISLPYNKSENKW